MGSIGAGSPRCKFTLSNISMEICMKYVAFVVTMLVIAGCGKTDQQADTAGTATQSSYASVIDEKNGYIVENAAIAPAGSTDGFLLAGHVRLIPGSGNVLIYRGRQKDVEEVLAVQFSSFTPGAAEDYTGGDARAQYWMIGGAPPTGMQSGIISGTLRFSKKEPSTVTLGLNRDVLQAVGTMEISVSNIDSGVLNLEPSRAFSAKYRLPVITFQELQTVSTPT